MLLDIQLFEGKLRNMFTNVFHIKQIDVYSVKMQFMVHFGPEATMIAYSGDGCAFLTHFFVGSGIVHGMS